MLQKQSTSFADFSGGLKGLDERQKTREDLKIRGDFRPFSGKPDQRSRRLRHRLPFLRAKGLSVVMSSPYFEYINITATQKTGKKVSNLYS